MEQGNWIDRIRNSAVKQPMPVLAFPGVQLIGVTVEELVKSAELQIRCICAMAGRYEMAAALTLMDLSLEAEAFGSTVRYSADEVPTVVGRIVETPEDAAALAVPAVGAGRTGLAVEVVRGCAAAITNRPVLAGMIGPFSLAGRLMDMTEIMCLCVEDPDMVHLVLSKVTAFLKEYIRAMKDAGADGLVLAEPAAGLLSPGMNAEFSVPYVREILESVRDDRFGVVYHNCGPYTIQQIGDILETGADILHFGNAIDMAEMARRIPPTQLFAGNIAPAEHFRNGTPESTAAATIALMQACGTLPNFIPSSGCDIPALSPLSNIDAFFAAVKSYYGQ